MIPAWRRRRRPGRALLVALVALVTPDARAARADRHEATVVVRPAGARVRLVDLGGGAPSLVHGAGLAAGAGWGVRNWLDVGLELSATVFREARHAATTLPLVGMAHTGELRRTTRLGHAQVGATLRLGAAWVPSIYLGAGVGGRLRSAPVLRVPLDGGDVGAFAPDDPGAAATIEAVASGRLGVAHRLDARWTVGAAAGFTAHVAAGAPDLHVLDATVSVAYSWYPVW